MGAIDGQQVTGDSEFWRQNSTCVENSLWLLIMEGDNKVSQKVCAMSLYCVGDGKEWWYIAGPWYPSRMGSRSLGCLCNMGSIPMEPMHVLLSSLD